MHVTKINDSTTTGYLVMSRLHWRDIGLETKKLITGTDKALAHHCIHIGGEGGGGGRTKNCGD